MKNIKKDHLFIELAITLIIPSIILMKLSEPQYLGAITSLLFALTFPLLWGIRSLIKERRVNLLAVLGLVNILLTGGIGLLQIDTHWLAVKEAAIPGFIGLAVAISAHTRSPLVRVLLYTPTLINIDRIQRRLIKRDKVTDFEKSLKMATWMLSGAFLFSAITNYFLAKWLVVSPAGSPAFNEELGRLTLLSYPMIALPSMLIMMGVLYFLTKTIHRLTGLKFTETLAH